MLGEARRHRFVQGKPVLLLVNKQDRDGALPAHKAESALAVEHAGAGNPAAGRVFVQGASALRSTPKRTDRGLSFRRRRPTPRHTALPPDRAPG